MCLALVLACNKEIIPNVPIEVTEGEEVTLSMSVSIPGMELATRALGEYNYAEGAHPSLWVVVFDQQGYFVQKERATNQKFESNENYPYNTSFEVTLTSSPEQRILHFILNYPDELPNSGHESAFVGRLSVGPNQDVYWQRVVLPNGILPSMKNNSVNPDYTKYVQPYVTNVPLVRNFAKVTVSENLDNFEILGFTVQYRPNKGTVAPYSQGYFVDYPNESYADLTDLGYFGYMPDDVEYTHKDITENDFVGKNNAVYLYENTFVPGRENVEKTPTIIIKGQYDSGNPSYYKADLMVQSVVPGQEDYANILRNFEYNLKITAVADHGGTLENVTDPNTPANNNLSGSLQIRDLTNITNGVSGLYVSVTDTTLVKRENLVIKYKFVSDLSKSTIANRRVEIHVEDGEVIAKKEDGTYDVTKTLSESGWSTLTVALVEQPSVTKEQTIIFYDSDENGSKLRREVIIRYRPKLDMSVQCDPQNVAKISGSLMTVNISIPNELTPALFPLDFEIESNTAVANNTTVKQYLSPAKFETLAVKTGKTIVSEEKYANQNSYQYIKSLSHDEYLTLPVVDGKRVISVFFVTNTSESASTVYVRNPYFNDANGSFGNLTTNPTKNFTNLAFEGVRPGKGRDVTFKFTMADATTPVNVTLIGVEPADNSGLVRTTGNKYTYTSTSSGQKTLSLKTLNRSGKITVVLNAEGYNTAVLTTEQDEYQFTNLVFDGGVPAQQNGQVTFKFKSQTANQEITVTLDGLIPATTDSELTHVEGNTYTYTTSANIEEDQTINLLTTEDEGTVSVKLDAYDAGYAPASLSAEQANTITINSATLDFTWNYDYAYYAGPDGVSQITVEGGIVKYSSVSFGGSNTNRSITLSGLIFEGDNLTDASKVEITIYRDGLAGLYSQTINTTIGTLKGN